MSNFAKRPSRAGAVGCLAVVLGLASSAAAEIYLFTDTQGVMHFSDVPHHTGYKPFRGVAHSHRRPVYGPRSKQAWDRMIVRVGKSHGISPGLVKAVIHAESAFDPRALSPKGAQGLMQLMPSTASELGVDDPFNPWQNIDGGTRYLSSLIKRFQGDLSLGLAAYHAGERTVRRYSGVPPYRETQRYVKQVLNLYRRYDAEFR